VGSHEVEMADAGNYFEEFCLKVGTEMELEIKMG
jgi:hypothetical protein